MLFSLGRAAKQKLGMERRVLVRGDDAECRALGICLAVVHAESQKQVQALKAWNDVDL